MSEIKLRFHCKEHGFVESGFGTNIEDVHFNQRGELGRWCPKCIKARPMTLLRYTGLKDKNNHEIYENNIIVGKIDMIGMYVKGKVIFIQGAFQILVYLNPEPIPLYGLRHIEIIGTNEENPDLWK